MSFKLRTKRTTLVNLVKVARENDGGAVASSWQAWRDIDGGVTVAHYSTVMVRVLANGEVLPISKGWESMTDKKGIGIITGRRYWDIFTK